MSITQAGIGIAIVASAIVVLADSIIPISAPITVASIKYADGMITVDRTIPESQGTTYMRRSSELLDAKTGERVPGCSGIADINYPAGHVVRTVPLAQFIGSPDCTPAKLPPGIYTPQAVYVAGEQQVVAVGETFRISE